MSLRPSFGPMLLSTLVVLALMPPSRSEEQPKKSQLTLNELSMEVVALQVLHQFQFTPAQMQKLRKLARETASDVGAREIVKASAEFQRTLASLRAALAEADKPGHIQELQEKIDKLRDAEKIELDDAVEVSEAAVQRAPEVLRGLSARQVATFVALYGEEFPDPLERLLEAIPKVRGLAEKEWKQLRDEVSEEVGRLVAGLDEDKAGEVSNQVVQLLIQARALKEAEFKKEQAELERTARDLVGNAGPLQVLQHVVERALAELLSNPRLAAAIDLRLTKKPSPAAPKTPVGKK
jgi:hypothetical protein